MQIWLLSLTDVFLLLTLFWVTRNDTAHICLLEQVILIKIELDNKVLFQGEKVFKLWWSFWVEPEAIHNVQITFVSKALLSFSQQPLWLWWNIQLLGTSKSIINNCIINYSLCVLISKETLITLIRFKIKKKN